MCLIPCSLTVRNEDREERNRKASHDVKAEDSGDCQERLVNSCVSTK